MSKRFPFASHSARLLSAGLLCLPAVSSLAASPAETEPAATPVAAAAAPQNEWDWVPADQLANQPEGCCTRDRGCTGAYVEPIRDWPDAEQKPEGSALRASSGSSQWQGDQVELQDQVVLTQGNTRLSARNGDFDRKNGRARLDNSVLIRQPGTLLRGDSAEIDTNTGLGDVNNARMLDYETGSRVTAEQLSRTAPDLFELKRASYTTCPPDDESWRLNARRIKLNRETGRGESNHTVLRVADVPVFYTPYLNFPIDDRRQTGFLWPSFGGSGDGFDFSAPLYLNLAPNYDATLTPRHIVERGTMLEAEGRYLGDRSYWELFGADLQNDNLTDERRWLAGMKQTGLWDSGISSYIDYREVSDTDYLKDFSLTSLDVRRQTHLAQQAGLGYGIGRWTAGLNAVQYQTLDELIAEPYRKLPQLTLNRVATNASFDLDYQFFGEAVRFDNPDSFDDGGTFTTGDRYYAEPGVVFPMRWKAGYIAPEARLRHVDYQLDSVAPGAQDEMSTTVPLAIVDSGLFFERDTSWGDGNYRQTLEPRIYYLYSSYEEQGNQPLFDTSLLTFTYQQLFQPHRFTGRDRLEDFNQLSTGVTTRYINSSSGRELFNASLGQIQYFEDRRVTLSGNPAAAQDASSNIAAQANLTPSDPVWSSMNLLWDPEGDKMQQGNVMLHVETGDTGLYNIGYRYYRATNDVSTLSEGIDQVDLSAAWPINERWRLFARWNYDLEDNRSVEDMFGAEYEDCCWLVRVVYQNAVEVEELNTVTGVAEASREEAIVVEFQLKGLGGLSREASTLLRESIWGYRERD